MKDSIGYIRWDLLEEGECEHPAEHWNGWITLFVPYVMIKTATADTIRARLQKAVREKLRSLKIPVYDGSDIIVLLTLYEPQNRNITGEVLSWFEYRMYGISRVTMARIDDWRLMRVNKILHRDSNLLYKDDPIFKQI